MLAFLLSLTVLSHAFIVAGRHGLLEYCERIVTKQKSGYFSHSFRDLLTTQELHLLYFVFGIDFVTTYEPAGYEIRNPNTVLGFTIDHKFGVV